MAAGASSPELFSSIISLFVTHSALGLGTIVGSEIFNQVSDLSLDDVGGILTNLTNAYIFLLLTQLVICAGAVYAGKLFVSLKWKSILSKTHGASSCL